MQYNQDWKYRLVIDTKFFGFLLSIIADALLSIFSVDYRLFYAFLRTCNRLVESSQFTFVLVESA